jgi:peptidoglycan/xylan/chitin deacetylase (PgdA/CDA1 family)
MIHQPQSGLVDKVHRRLARYVHCRAVPTPTRGPIVSFGFDDCPRSVLETALPLLEAEGWRATLYVACGLCDTTNHLGLHMSRQDVLAAHEAGHEIADHTYQHLDAQDVSLSEYLADIDANQTALTDLGIPTSQHFAYPYGSVKPAVKKALSARFLTSRGVNAAGTQDANLLPAQRLYHGPTIDQAITAIENLSNAPRWLNLFSHDVRETPSDYGCTAADLSRVIKAVKESGARVMTVGAAYDTLQSETAR